MAATDERKTRTIRMDLELCERIDRARGGIPWEVWARDVFELVLLRAEISDELVEKLWCARGRDDIRRVLSAVLP
jgi:hypothetical protein